MAKNKRYVVETSNSMEVSLKDNLTKKYIFSIICVNIDEFEPLITEVMNVCAEMNKLWAQVQRFEGHNQRLMEENEQLKSRIKYLERKIQRERASAMKQHEKWEKELEMKTEKRYELYNKYNPNEILQDNYNVLDGDIQIYDAETVEFELNDLFNRLKNIRNICNDCLKIKNHNDVGYCVGITEIRKIVEESIEEDSEVRDVVWND